MHLPFEKYMTPNVVFQFLLVAIYCFLICEVIRGSMCSGVNLYCCNLCGFDCEV